MNLFDFEKEINSTILERGRKYYNDEMIISLEENRKGIWSAEIEGSYDKYDVEIKIKNGAEIEYWDCNCPYDYGDICKHSVAVLLKIREANTIQIKSEKMPKQKKQNAKLSLKKLLDKISPEEMQTFILEYARKNKDFTDEFELYFAEKDENFDIGAKYEQIIKKLIRQHTKRGFIDYHDSNNLAKALRPVLGNAEKFFEQKNYRDAYLLNQKFLSLVTPVIEYSDDSNGYIGDLIDDSVQLLDDIGQNVPYSLQEKIYEFIQDEIKKEYYFDYGDFGYNLLNTYEYLAKNLGKKDEFVQFIDQKIKSAKRTNKSYDYDYDYNYFTEVKIRLLSEEGNEEELQKLVEQNIEIPEIRILEVEKAIKNNDFEKAKKLLQEGVKIAEKLRHAGTVHQWEQILLAIAVTENDTKITRYFTKKYALSNSFDSNYYNQWKKTFEQDEWKVEIDNTIQDIINKINDSTKRFSWGDNSSTFLHYLGPIYVQENYLDKLIELIRQQSRIENVMFYQNNLKPNYGKELVEIYEKLLVEFAETASSRPNYRELVRFMKKIIKDFPEAKEKIVEVAHQLKLLYPRRPAMLEELNKFLLKP